MAKKAKAEAELAQSIELLPIGSLTPHGSNPRQGDIGAVCESIARNGWYGAVLAYVSESGVLTIIVGEHRWRALMELQRHGIDLDSRHHSYAELSATVPLPVTGKVPVIVRRDLSDEQAVRIMLADNRTAELADYNVGVLTELLECAATAGGLSGTGWDGESLQALIEGQQTPSFTAVSEAEQGRLDQKKPITCPECGHEFTT